MVVIKTIIELFDTCQIENIIAALHFNPEKIVFVGFKKVMTDKRREALRRFFELKKMNVQLEYKVVARYDYENIFNSLNEIIDENEDVCFDLTGGKELVLVAMGEICALRSVPMIQFDVRSGELIRVKNCENVPETGKTVMTIMENMVLVGGSVVESETQPKWELTADFEKDAEAMWEICRENCRRWNRFSGILKGMEFGTGPEDGLYVEISAGQSREMPEETVVDKLKEKGLIKNYVNNGKSISFRYKNEQVRRCITKAGNILELYVYMLATRIAKKDPTYYDDIDTGVMVDWDGVFDGRTDTRNEIDVILMRDLVPVFISCKNGEVHKEALYELNTVAEKFGGEHAKKVLVCTYISYDNISREYILQRARDMKIEVIDNVDKLSDEEFLKTVRKRIR